MSSSLAKAIVARVKGTEVLTGDLLLAQQALVTLFGGTPRIRKGATASKATLPCLTFWFDSGPESMGATDSGEIRNVIARFFIWTKTREGEFFGDVADALEHLFNERRGATLLVPTGVNQIFCSDLFTDLQEPDHDDATNDFYAFISFRFIEARP